MPRYHAQFHQTDAYDLFFDSEETDPEKVREMAERMFENGDGEQDPHGTDWELTELTTMEINADETLCDCKENEE